MSCGANATTHMPLREGVKEGEAAVVPFAHAHMDHPPTPSGARGGGGGQPLFRVVEAQVLTTGPPTAQRL